MNAAHEINRWDTGSRSISRLEKMHKALGRLSNVSSYLIYEDQNFLKYLSAIMRAPEQHAFLHLTDSGPDSGFCHFIMDKKTLFLNNIYVDNRYQRQGLGSKLLQGALAYLNGTQYEEIQLDVFSSNPQALSWYRRMGFVSTRQTRWQTVGQAQRETSTRELQLKSDTHGFQQIYVQGTNVGSRINRRAIISESQYYSALGRDLFDGVLVRKECSGQDYSHTTVEVSTRFSSEVGSVLSYLQKT